METGEGAESARASGRTRKTSQRRWARTEMEGSKDRARKACWVKGTALVASVACLLWAVLGMWQEMEVGLGQAGA